MKGIMKLALVYSLLGLIIAARAEVNYSPNMNLPVPIVGVTKGPDYANDINECMSLVDSHDHSPGYGVKVTPAGMNINLDLEFNNNDATELRSTRYQTQVSDICGGSDLRDLYVKSADLYYCDGDGNAVRITQSGAVAGTPGSITNLVAPASATYVSGTPAFVFQSNTNTPANLDGGSLVLRNITANSKGITVNAPGALASDYSVTFPAAPPASTSVMTMSNTGAIALTRDPSVTTVTASGLITGDSVKVGSSGATLTSSSALISDGNGTGLFYPYTASRAALLGGMPPTGSTNTLSVAKAGGATAFPIVVSAQPSMNGLLIVEGGVGETGVASCSTEDGEGFTCAYSGTGSYAITFTASIFASAPRCVCSPVAGAFCNFNGGKPTTSGFTVNLFNSSAAALNGPVSFICIGQRGD